MTKKVEINIIYAPQKGAPHIIYENDKGIIWRSNSRDNNKINVGMGWYSLRNPRGKPDSLLVVEPYCVLPKDYEVKFGRRFQYIFTWATKAFTHPAIKDKLVGINHPSCWGREPKPDAGHDWPSWKERKNEIVFVANNKTSTHESQLYTTRIEMADFLNKHSKYEVSWYGQIPLKRSYYKGNLENKIEALKKAKFSVCTENSYHPIYTHNYFTEKLPEVWISGTVPIYMGCYNIDSFAFPKNSYIDLRSCISSGRANKLHIDKGKFREIIMKKINEYNQQDYEKYAESVKKEILRNGKLYKLVAFEKMYETIIDTFLKK